jgi:hypothetical protein
VGAAGYHDDLCKQRMSAFSSDFRLQASTSLAFLSPPSPFAHFLSHPLSPSTCFLPSPGVPEMGTATTCSRGCPRATTRCGSRFPTATCSARRARGMGRLLGPGSVSAEHSVFHPAYKCRIVRGLTCPRIDVRLCSTIPMQAVFDFFSDHLKPKRKGPHAASFSGGQTTIFPTRAYEL